MKFIEAFELARRNNKRMLFRETLPDGTKRIVYMDSKGRFLSDWDGVEDETGFLVVRPRLSHGLTASDIERNDWVVE